VAQPRPRTRTHIRAPALSDRLSKEVRARFTGETDGDRWACPYDCDEDFATPDERLEHMRAPRHAEETRKRLVRLERALGMEAWRDEAACRGSPSMILEAGSKRRDVRRAGELVPTKAERAAFTLCVSCPVRRECATASLVPLVGFTSYDRVADAAVNVVQGIWAGVPWQQRAEVVKALGTGPEAVEMLLTVGERLAREYPGDPADLRPANHPTPAAETA
jgi:hypothetical protein